MSVYGVGTVMLAKLNLNACGPPVGTEPFIDTSAPGESSLPDQIVSEFTLIELRSSFGVGQVTRMRVIATGEALPFVRSHVTSLPIETLRLSIVIMVHTSGVGVGV